MHRPGPLHLVPQYKKQQDQETEGGEVGERGHVYTPAIYAVIIRGHDRWLERGHWIRTWDWAGVGRVAIDSK